MENETKIRTAVLFEITKCSPFFRLLKSVFFFFALFSFFGNFASAQTTSHMKSVTDLKKFSVIIPIYNTEKYLPECIESVVNQSYPNLEIILVNDGSPGNADEICQKYAQRDRRIKYIKQENQGVSIARNNGIAASSGDYIFFADSDDTLESEFIEKISKVFEKESCDCVVIGENFCRIPTELIGALPAWGIAVTRNFLEKHPDVRFQEHMQPSEDGLFTHKLMALTKNISFCKSAVYFYRQHAASSEHNIDKNKMLREIPRLLKLLEEFYTKYGLWNEKLHLLAFIRDEPFARYHRTSFSASERKHLFDLLHNFLKKHDLNNVELASNFSRHFYLFVTSDFYFTYNIRHYTDVAMIFCKSIFLAMNECKNDLIRAITKSLKKKTQEIRNSYDTKETGKTFTHNVSNKKKLLLIGEYLISGQGGVGHVLCDMANFMNESGYDVTVATIDNKQGNTFFSLNKDVKFVNLYEKISLVNKFKTLITADPQRFFIKLRHRNDIFGEFIKNNNPDLIICFSLPILFDVTYKKDFNIPVILTVHGNPINDYSNRFWPRPDWMNKLLEETYQKATVVQVLLDSYRDTVPKSFRGEVVTISNIAKKFGNFSIDYYRSGQKKIVCIASLDDRKHQDLLIRAFSSIAKDYPEWVVELWGSGPKKEEYQKMISDFSMTDRIFLKGSTKNVEKVLKDTDIFALPSTCEGWPLVLGEAMNMGIPCVGLSICDGVNEIINHNKNGILSKNSPKDFAEKLKNLMNNPKKREKMGIQAKKDMKSHSENIIWGKWKDLIRKYTDKVL